jgi:hypothetical protein
VACGLDARDVSGFLVTESPSVLFRNPDSKHLHESGRDTKGNRTLRKFSIARAIPWTFLRSFVLSRRLFFVTAVPRGEKNQATQLRILMP